MREHRIEYLLPAFEGEEVEIRTWVENVRRVRSLRKYEFVRKADGKVLVKGETDWVFGDVKTGAPRAIPEVVSTCIRTSNQSIILKNFSVCRWKKIYQADNEAAFKAQGYPIKVEIHSMPKPGR